jgi:phospholipase/carboxylesterase
MANIHQGEPLLTKGEPLGEAKAALIMIHGRGGGPASITPLISHIGTEGYAYLIPQAADLTWYPHRFLVPREQNEPYLTSALTAIDDLVKQVEAAHIPAERIAFLGFSQGACLALEYAARHPRRYGGVIAYSGGLIGADHELSGYPDSLEGTPVFIGCSDMDDHIPLARIKTTTATLQALGAQVTERIYPRMGHTINTGEIAFTKDLLTQVLANA